ncbi:hypothetical protein AB0J80_20245 [Actinoplanes sp. NPDC049548]|uniref:hypothetical protein n=1 Tax=Actinoplanes sp. NPDC049548 TaxID=3155152 RepID=UPI003449E77A
MSTAPEPPPWVQWPVRVFAVVVVLPLRLAWELLSAVGRFLERWVGRPLAWLWHRAVMIPLSFLWRRLVVVPLSFLWRWSVVVPFSLLGRWFWAHRRFLSRPFVWLLRYLVVVPVVWFFSVTAPVWQAVGRAVAWTLETLVSVITAVARVAYRWFLLPGWRGAGWLLRQLYRWILRPAGLVIAGVWRWTVVPAWRVAAGAGRWVRDTVVRPGAGMARAVLVSVGLLR